MSETDPSGSSATPTLSPVAVVAQATGLAKRYQDGLGVRVVLDVVSIEVHARQLVGIQGPSGCGKTTLLDIVAGLLRPDAGTVTLSGTALDFSNRAMVAQIRRQHVGVVSQDFHLLADESVVENIALPLRFGTNRPSRAERRRLVDQAMTWAALDVDPKRKVRTLSGGERQRVAIARALVREPNLIIADEPTASLDADTGAMIITQLVDVAQRGAAVLVATHDPAVIEACTTHYQFTGPKLLEVPGA